MERLRLRRYIRTQRSRLCQRMTFPTWLMINYAQKGMTQMGTIFILRYSVWMTMEIALVCDLLVFYKPATNMLQICYKPATNLLETCYKPATVLGDPWSQRNGERALWMGGRVWLLLSDIRGPGIYKPDPAGEYTKRNLGETVYSFHKSFLDCNFWSRRLTAKSRVK